MKFCNSILLLPLICLTLGCASKQLLRETPRHSATLADIYEQQVLDNLAKFATHPGSTPSFAVPTSGTTGITHSNTATGGLSFNPTTLTGASLNLNGMHQLGENWTMRPVTDPRRLELMKCVFHYVACKNACGCCDDCLERLSVFFQGDLSACELPRCFYSVESGPKCPPTDFYHKVGHYCGTWVVVPSAKSECLSRITMAILDIATLDDAAFAIRIAGKKEAMVEISETFIARIGNHNSVVTGKYSIKADDYKKLQQNGSSPRLPSDPPLTMGPEDTSDTPALDGIQLYSPFSPYFDGYDARLRSNGISDIESQIQLNQLMN